MEGISASETNILPIWDFFFFQADEGKRICVGLESAVAAPPSPAANLLP